MGMHIQIFSQLLVQVRHWLKVVLLSPISAMMMEWEPGHVQKIVESFVAILQVLEMSCRGWYELTPPLQMAHCMKRLLNM
jgi:hypothetical protein